MSAPPPRPASAPPPARQVVSASGDSRAAATAAKDIKEIKGMLSGITQRLGALEGRMQKLERQAVKGDDVKIKKLSGEVKSLATHLGVITQGLNNTPDYNLREEFQCTHCGSKGTVATKHRCTNCEKEGWWGWWPVKKR
jgi:hypothetical protein